MTERTRVRTACTNTPSRLSRFDYQSMCRSVNRHDTLPENDTYAMTHCFPLFSASSHFCCARCSAFFQPSFSPFSLFSAPLKLGLPILHFSLSLWFIPSDSHPPFLQTHRLSQTYRVSLSLCSVSRPKSCHFSPSPIHIYRPQWAIFYPSTSCHPPSPFSAFCITILSDSFIHPLSSFIPLPIISASLPSMTHSPIRPIHLPALFLHQCCHFCQPISPSSVLLPPLSLQI